MLSPILHATELELASSLVITCVVLHLQPEGLGPPMRLDEFLERRAREVLPHVERVAEAAHELDEGRDGGVRAVSYTHLTLPTICSV